MRDVSSNIFCALKLSVSEADYTAKSGMLGSADDFGHLEVPYSCAQDIKFVRTDASNSAGLSVDVALSLPT